MIETQRSTASIIGVAVVGCVHLLCCLRSTDSAQRTVTAHLTVDDIVKIWRQRQHLVRSAVFEWSIERTIFPRSCLDEYGQPAPSETVTNRGDGCRLVFTNGKIAYRYHPVDLRSDGVRNPRARSAITFDGSKYLSYTPAGLFEYDEAYYDGRDFTEMGNYNIWALLLNYRLFDESSLGMSPAALELRDRFETINGVECVVMDWLQIRGRRELLVNRLPPHQILSFREYQLRGNGNGNSPAEYLRAQLDITYSPNDPAEITVPNGWILRHFGPDRPRKTANCKVTDFAFNRAVPESEFTLKPFPVGTLIVDERDGSRWWQRERGRLERVGSDLPPPRNDGLGPMLLVVNGALVVALLIGIWWLRRSRAT